MGAYLDQIQQVSPDAYAKLQKLMSYSANEAFKGVPQDWQAQIFTALDTSKLNAPQQLEGIGKYVDSPTYSTNEYGQDVVTGTQKVFQRVDDSLLPKDIKANHEYGYNGEFYTDDLTGYSKKLGTVNGLPITANYDSTGKLTGYTTDSSIRNFISGNQSFSGSWDASGKATPQQYTSGGGGFLGNFLGDLSGIVSDLGPLGTIALSALVPGAGTALTALNTANAAVNGGSLSDIAKTAGAAYLGSQLGSSVGTDTGSNVIGNTVSGTTTGLLSGQNLNEALTSGAYAGAGTGLSNVVNTPSSNTSYTPTTTDFTAGADYSAPSTGGGLGLKAEQGQGTNLFANTPSNFDLGGAQGLQLPQASNLSDMGGGQGLTIPSASGTGVLGATGVTNNALDLNNQITGNPSTDTSASSNSNILPASAATALLKSLLGGGTGTNMADTTQTQTQNNAALGNLLGGLLGGVGGLMQGSTNTDALKQYANAITQAGTQAQAQGAFRPVGTTTTFGTSSFTIDPVTGQVTSAGYTLSPEAKAIQDALMAGTRSSLQDVTATQNLGRGYLATSPEAAAQQWYQQQQNILAPQREQQMAKLNQANYNQGTTGLRVGGTSAGGLKASNPLAQALANAWSQQDTGLLGQAQEQGRAATNFGTGLLSNAYAPVNAGLTSASTLEKLGQQPLGLSTDLASLVSQRGAVTGGLGLNAATKAGDLMSQANSWNPVAKAMISAGSSPIAGNALGSLFGNTGLGQSLGSWLNNLSSGYNLNALGNAAYDWAQANPDIIPQSTDSSYNGNYGMDAELLKQLGLA